MYLELERKVKVLNVANYGLIPGLPGIPYAKSQKKAWALEYVDQNPPLQSSKKIVYRYLVM